MGKIDFFSIILYKPDKVYYSSESVVGNVSIRVLERLKCNSISMMLSGKARVHWSESSGSGKTRNTRKYTAIEEYLQTKIIFLIKQSNYDLYLEVGDYSYPFEILLPPDLPASFEHKFGQIRYSLSATINIPWAFDKHTQKSISVISEVNLNNLNPIIKKSYRASGTKIFCCWCCASEPVSIKFEISKGCYVPGENIDFKASIENKSSRELKHLTVDLIQNLKFHASGETRKCSRKVAQVTYQSKIPSRSSENWTNGCLPIPAVCPSSNNTCKIIEISYMVNFMFGAKNSLDTSLSIPIIVGSIPFTSDDQLAQVELVFEDCIFGSNPNKELDIHFEKGDVVESDSANFKPIYPVYKNYSIKD